MDLNTDLPISTEEEDGLDRLAFVNRLCEIASSVNSDAAFVVGVSGAWGFGKTSVLNLTAQRLEESEKIQVVRFNPWMISSQEQMVRVFFNELITGISKSGKRGTDAANTIVQLMNEYYQSIEPLCTSALTAAMSCVAPAPVAAAGGNFVSRFFQRILGKAADKTDRANKPLSKLKAEICEILSQQFFNTVVLIDDLDRLDNEEIRQIFKLVNLTASFPRIVYVLAYDADVIDRALFQVQGASGRNYLEKIVQVEMPIPGISRQDLLSLLSSEIEGIVDDYELELLSTEEERKRFLALFDSIIISSISTPRRIARFSNLFRINADKGAGQICASDMVAMTVIQMLYPNTIQWITRHKDEICGNKYRFLSEGEIAEDMVSELEAAAENDAISYRSLLLTIQNLFPSASRLLTGESAHNSLAAGAAKARGRVSSVELLSLFLSEQNPSCITRPRLHQTLAYSGEEEIHALINEAINHGELNDLMHFAQEEIETLPDVQIELIAKCLVRCFGRTKEIEYALLTKRESDELLGKTLRRFFERLGSKKSSEIMHEAVASFRLQNFTGLVFFIRDERLAQLDGQTRDTPCITPECYNSLAYKYAETVISCAQEIIRSGDIRPLTIARAIVEDNELPLLEKLTSLIHEDTGTRAVYCADRLGRFYGTDGPGFSREGVGIDVELSDVENLIHDEELNDLSIEARTRLAALYILLQNPEMDEVHESAAIAVAEKWNMPDQ